MTKPTKLWEILVPTERRSDGAPISTRFHRVWDARVREISGGLTIFKPVKGHWVDQSSDDNTLYSERMIPVRFIASEDDMEAIVAMTGVYYDQLVILCYEISQNVVMRTLDECKSYTKGK